MFYCSHCGSKNTDKIETGNHGVLMVAEEFDGCIECYDPDIIIIKCEDCDKLTYPSV